MPLSLAGLLVPFLLASPPADAALARPAPDKPNIILVLVDDLGQQDVSVPMLDPPSALNRRYRTPNLEALAARGVRFSNAYAAAPVCTPSRTAILTGQSPARTHITYWTLEKDADTSSRHPRLDPPAWRVNGLAPSPELLPERLRAAGYRTIHVGKAHWGARGTPGADPLEMGFDINVAGHAAGAPGSFLGTDWFKDAARKQRGKIAPQDAPAGLRAGRDRTSGSTMRSPARRPTPSPRRYATAGRSSSRSARTGSIRRSWRMRGSRRPTPTSTRASAPTRR
jgi:arylsulfatase A-like enzyme